VILVLHICYIPPVAFHATNTKIQIIQNESSIRNENIGSTATPTHTIVCVKFFFMIALGAVAVGAYANTLRCLIFFKIRILRRRRCLRL
jgi:hypothetical protein